MDPQLCNAELCTVWKHMGAPENKKVRHVGMYMWEEAQSGTLSEFVVVAAVSVWHHLQSKRQTRKRSFTSVVAMDGVYSPPSVFVAEMGA